MAFYWNGNYQIFLLDARDSFQILETPVYFPHAHVSVTHLLSSCSCVCSDTGNKNTSNRIKHIS